MYVSDKPTKKKKSTFLFRATDELKEENLISSLDIFMHFKPNGQLTIFKDNPESARTLKTA